jgi:3-oxoacyl-[acyl-carrier protein] reductase
MIFDTAQEPEGEDQMSNLSGKVALVTGGSRGIGAAIALRLAKDGAAVVVNYAKNAEAAESVVKAIEENGGRAVAIQADIASPDDVKRLVESAVTSLGRLDILVNNAGWGEFRPLEQLDTDHIASQFALNVFGLLETTREAAARFGQEGGSVVNLSSVVGSRPLAGGSVYSATKAAVESVTISLARELGPKGVRVNAVAPGPVETDLMRGALDEATLGYFISRTPLGRVGTPDDIADVVAFLVSNEARWVTGQTIGADGGINP